MTIAALSSLALAIGANATIFTLLNALLLKPLAVSEPERLALITDAQRYWPERPPGRSRGLALPARGDHADQRQAHQLAHATRSF